MKRAGEKDQLLSFIWPNRTKFLLRRHPWIGFYYHWLGGRDWIWCPPQKDPRANKSCKALLMTLTCLDTSRVIERERGRKQQSEDGWGRAQRWVTVIIDFPSALQWRFSTNIFCHNARRKHLIRWWYERHENGKSFMRGWLQKLILTDRDMRWHKLGIDLTAIYEDAP